MKDTIQTIRRSSYLFFSGTLLSRISGMARDISMAYAFGTQPSIAAFMVAFRFAHLLRRLFGEGALQSAFIPEFEALRHQNEQHAFSFFKNLSLILSIFLILLIGISSGIMACFLYWGHINSDNYEIIFLTLIMLPSLLFICLFGLNASLLQCEKYYFISSVAPVAFNGIWLISIFYIKEMPAEQAMPWLSFGVVIACLCQWLMTVPQTWKSLIKNLPISTFLCSLRTASFDLRKMGKPLFLGILGVGASQINNAIDSLFARFAEAEGPALLWYAIRIQQLPLALFGIAIAGSILPPLSRALKANKPGEFHCFLQDAFSRTWTFMLPFTGAIFIMGDSIVNILYGRGDFDSGSVIGTTYCLWAYGIGLLPSALVLVLAPANYAQSNYKFPALASFAAMILNFFLNALFIIGLGWGATSVAIATSISAWMNFILLGLNLSRSGFTFFSIPLLKNGGIVSLASLGAFLGTYAIRIKIQLIPFFSETLFTKSFSHQFFILSCQMLAFGFFFFIFFYLITLSFHPFKSKNLIMKSID